MTNFRPQPLAWSALAASKNCTGAGRKVGLREHEDRAHAHLAREDQIAFDARNIEILVAGCDDEKRIDVCRDKLKTRCWSLGAGLLNRLVRSRMRTRFRLSRSISSQSPTVGRSSGPFGAGTTGRDRVLEPFARDIHHSAMNRHDSNRLARAEPPRQTLAR